MSDAEPRAHARAGSTPHRPAPPQPLLSGLVTTSDRLAALIAWLFAIGALGFVGLAEPLAAGAFAAGALASAAGPLANRAGFVMAGRVIPLAAAGGILVVASASFGLRTLFPVVILALIPAPLGVFDPTERRPVAATVTALGVLVLLAAIAGARVDLSDDLVTRAPMVPAATLFVTFGLMLGVVGLIADRIRAYHGALTGELSERASLERAANRAREVAEAQARARSELTATVAHELRSPLNGLIGLADLVRRTHLDRTQRELVHQLSTTAGHMRVVIDDILDVARMDAGAMHLAEVPFLLGEAVEAAVIPFVRQVGIKRVALNLDLKLEADLEVRGDPSRLRQVITNLVSNAAKYTQDGFIDVRVLGTIDGAEVALRIEVEDTGTGIPSDRVAQIFEPFAEGGAKPAEGSTGLGLTIARRLLDRMGGTLTVQTEQDIGSTFNIDLRLPLVRKVPHRQYLAGLHIDVVTRWPRRIDPLQRALSAYGAKVRVHDTLTGTRDGAADLVVVDQTLDDATLDDVHLLPDGQRYLLLRSDVDGTPDAVLYPCARSALRRAVSAVIAGDDDADLDAPDELTSPPFFLGLHVLVAEDSGINQLVLRRLLDHHGVTCDVVGDGHTACQTFDPDRHHLVLMDVEMPDVDGREAARWIRDRVGASVPIVAVSGNVPTPSDQELFDTWLIKPLDDGALITVLARVHARRARRPEAS